MAALFVVGMLLGITLYSTAFGFTSAYRRLLLYRETDYIRAQIVMLAVATGLFAPVLAASVAFNQPVAGADAPFGLQVAIGAFLFGIGMQLAGGCGSGTLYLAGGGNLRFLAVLAAFCAGSFWASLHMSWWQEMPSAGPLVLGEMIGWPAAVALQLGFLWVITVGLKRWGKPRLVPITGSVTHYTSLWRYPWPPLAGALLLALLNFATLLLAGHPWTITWAFTLWGAKAAWLLGWDPAASVFWNNGFPHAALGTSIWQDVTSVMDIGLMVGAFCAAVMAGRLAVRQTTRFRTLVAAILGGLVMGYGARIAYGCNIGAFFSGVASTSLHGWLWIFAALPGTWVGVKMRPVFGLEN